MTKEKPRPESGAAGENNGSMLPQNGDGFARVEQWRAEHHRPACVFETKATPNTYVDLTNVVMRRPRFLYTPLLPENVICLLAGPSDVGKSTLVLDWIAKATHGRLEGDHKGKPGTILVYSKEDDDSMLKARLTAAGADLKRVVPFYRKEVVTLPGGSSSEQRAGYQLPDDLPLLETAIIDTKAIALMIDPITDFIGGDSNKRDDVRKALNPLAALAAKHGITVIGLLHFNKGAGYASDKVSGSHAFRDICRSLVLVVKDMETGKRVATLDKSNYTQAADTSYEFTLTDHELTDDDGETLHVGSIGGWQETDTNVGAVISKNYAQAEPEGNQCELDLIDYLSDQKGSAPKSEIIEALKADWTKYQLEHAQQNNPRITSERSGYPARAVWSLVKPAKQAKPANPPISNGSRLAATGETDTVQPTPAKQRNPQNINDSPPHLPSLASLAGSTGSTTQSMLGEWTHEDRDAWLHDILTGTPPSDDIYLQMEVWMLQLLAGTRGVYATKAIRELQRRNHGEHTLAV